MCAGLYGGNVAAHYNRRMTTSPPSAPPEFPRLDPASAAFWDVRFDEAFTPWDQGGVPADFATFVRNHKPDQPKRVLIPGCGAAREVQFLVEARWPVVAIDFSASAVKAARAWLGEHGTHVVEADFFSFDPAPTLGTVEVIYERAFLCALPPRLREAWAARVAALLSPGGLLAGFFYFDPNPKGPPFGISTEELHQLLAPHFECVEERIPTDSIAVFAGKERWQVWRRR